MDLERKIDLISQPPTEEIITQSELRALLETKEHPVAYDGFEPSGLAHLGSGLLKAIKVKDFFDAGCRYILWIADLHALINNKLGGNLELIKKAGKYLEHTWYACGVPKGKIEIKWVSDAAREIDYWRRVIEISRATTLRRMMRCVTIMGRKESEIHQAAQLLYPAMQAADIFWLGVDICQLGMDQRRANILAREVGEKMKWWKPVCVHHHMLMGLHGPTKMGGFDENKVIDLQISSKMSKSIPKTAVFVHDTPEEIKEKVMSALCPERDVESNPVLEICKHIVFRRSESLVIRRSKKYGGDVELQNYAELEAAYREGKIHPLDLKEGVASSLAEILEPAREYFANNAEARKLLEEIRAAEVTR